MPAAVIKKAAKKLHKSAKALEKYWEKAKEAAEKAGQAENYAYIMSIWKQMVGYEPSSAMVEVKLMKALAEKERQRFPLGGTE